MHLDGARLLNAAVAHGVAPAAIAARFDTVTLCLSKGLGCPLGALLAGSTELIERAWREKHLFGGAMRQAGIVAAAGVYALDHHVERLAEDHARARRLAEALAAAGLPVDLEQVETNFVQIDVAPLGLTRDEALARLREAGVGLSSTIHPTCCAPSRTSTSTDEDIDRRVRARPARSGALARSEAPARSTVGRSPAMKNATTTADVRGDQERTPRRRDETAAPEHDGVNASDAAESGDLDLRGSRARAGRSATTGA